MNRISVAGGIALVAMIVCGCINPDPLQYETPLPNGLRHFSNGGERGWIGTPFIDGSSSYVYPVPGADKWYCNEFAVIGDDVIGIEIQYAYRAYVDPPIATRWFYLDTKNRTATTFDSLNALREHCQSLGYASLPAFIRRTSDTKERF